MKFVMLLAGLAFLAAAGCGGRSMQTAVPIEAEKAAIRQVLETSIGWAAAKDTAQLYGCFADDPALFYFTPRDNGTVSGFAQLKQLTESFFLHPDFSAVRYEIRDLGIHVGGNGTVAWYHARLDDFNTWKGQHANWEDVRWTGVLEKRKGAWKIVQMHFSSAIPE